LKKTFFIFLFLVSTILFAQDKRISITHADFLETDEENYPDATIGLGNVFIEVDGATLRCKKAILYNKNNYLQALGDVILNQGDTIIQTSKYIEYDGQTKQSLSWGDVILKNETMTLKTDTLQFDRVAQQLYYKHHATIEDDTNVLESKTGNYFLNESKFQAETDVVITNPDYILKSNHLDYYTNSGLAYLYGKSTITGKESFIYCEKGFYDTKADISHFTKNAYILYKDRRIDGDSLYYDRRRGFASASRNIIMTDTVNKTILKGNYAEYYRKKDSAFVVNRAVAITKTEKDSIFIHGDTLLFTGKPDKRIVRAYHHVKFFKPDMSGKCDSLHSDQATGLLRMFKKPILWTENGQVTGNFIHLLSNVKTEKLDSMKVLGNAFMIQKDTIDGFNQIKGRDMFAKFANNKIKTVDFVGNGETLTYLRDDETTDLIGIAKTTCSKFHIEFVKQQITEIRYLVNEDGKTYPPSELPENARKLKDFIWREDERPLTKDDIFIKDKVSKSKEKSLEKKATKKNILGIK
jgi:lipopolysaccharide export system protein LptA